MKARQGLGGPGAENQRFANKANIGAPSNAAGGENTGPVSTGGVLPSRGAEYWVVRKPRFCLSGRPGAPRAPPWGLAGRGNPELPTRPGPGAGSQARPAPGARPSQGRQWLISERLNRGAHASAPQTRTHALPLTNRVHPNCTDSLGDGAAAHAGLKMSSLATAGGAPGKNPENTTKYRGF